MLSGQHFSPSVPSFVGSRSFQWAEPKQLLASLLCSLQVACVEVEGCRLHPMAQPLDLQTLDEVVLVVLTDDLLQFLNLVLQTRAQFSLHLLQNLPTAK